MVTSSPKMTKNKKRKTKDEKNPALVDARIRASDKDLPAKQCQRPRLSIINSRYMPGSFHLSFFVIFGNEVTKISCHFQAKTVQLIFSFFIIYEKRKWDETLING